MQTRGAHIVLFASLGLASCRSPSQGSAVKDAELAPAPRGVTPSQDTLGPIDWNTAVLAFQRTEGGENDTAEFVDYRVTIRTAAGAAIKTLPCSGQAHVGLFKATCNDSDFTVAYTEISNPYVRFAQVTPTGAAPIAFTCVNPAAPNPPIFLECRKKPTASADWNTAILAFQRTEGGENDTAEFIDYRVTIKNADGTAIKTLPCSPQSNADLFRATCNDSDFKVVYTEISNPFARTAQVTPTGASPIPFTCVAPAMANPPIFLECRKTP